MELVLFNEKITTAKKNDFLEIVGTTTNPLKFHNANDQYACHIRPLIAKGLQLTCLFF
jgi:hypothetical protein